VKPTEADVGESRDDESRDEPRRIALSPCSRPSALAGCGLGAGPAPTAVKLSVTRDFGARRDARTPVALTSRHADRRQR
jgi:hypothetical protein